MIHLEANRTLLIPIRTVLGVAPAIACVSWVATVSTNRAGDYQIVGPYYIPIIVEWIVSAAAVGLAVIAIAAGGRRAGRRCVGLAAASAIVGAVAAAALAWRVITASGGGANIGGGLAILGAPLAIALLLCAALSSERTEQRVSRQVLLGGVPLLIATALAVTVLGVMALS